MPILDLLALILPGKFIPSLVLEPTSSGFPGAELLARLPEVAKFWVHWEALPQCKAKSKGGRYSTSTLALHTHADKYTSAHTTNTYIHAHHTHIQTHKSVTIFFWLGSGSRTFRTTQKAKCQPRLETVSKINTVMAVVIIIKYIW